MRMGASGFRVDMAGSLVKGDEGQKETIRLWRKLSGALKREFPEAFLISEWSEPDKAVRAGFDADFLLHFGPHASAYLSLFRKGAKSFFHRSGKGDIRNFLSVFQKLRKQAAGKGHVCVPSGNHDFARIAKDLSQEELKVAFAFLLTLPGLPFIYYGDEIGMRYLEGLPSKEGGYERTGTRTPMQWEEGRNKGFSKADPSRFYLPVDRSKGAPTVVSQQKDRDSLLATVRSLARLRQAHPALQAGASFKVLTKGRHLPLAYLRERDGERVLLVLNPAGRRARYRHGQSGRPVTLLARGVRVEGRDFLMAGSSFGVLGIV
jgi:maltose alpha-D-glucosyltransferase/alpha-amylase